MIEGCLITSDFTQLLSKAELGDSNAYDSLVLRVYDELRGLAEAFLRQERSGHTLQPTALVHEAYLRLLGQEKAEWKNKAQFYRVSAQMMRRILIDHARKSRAAKRGGDHKQISMTRAAEIGLAPNLDLLALDEALKKLASFDPRKSQIVELKFFGGLTSEETAKVLDLSTRTLERDWEMARTWLFSELSKGDEHRTLAKD